MAGDFDFNDELSVLALRRSLVTTMVMLQESYDLIRWLARTYGDNDPVIALSGIDGEPLAANISLMRTWQRVVRGNSSWDIPETEDAAASASEEGSEDE